MRGQFELTLSDGKKIPMRFCTWSLKRFCQLQGIGPSDIGEALSGQTSLDAIINLLKAAAEYPLYSQGITPSFSEIEVCDCPTSFLPDHMLVPELNWRKRNCDPSHRRPRNRIPRSLSNIPSDKP